MLLREYGLREPRWAARDLWASWKSLVQLCLFEGDRLRKLGGVVRGLRDGLLRRMGPR